MLNSRFAKYRIDRGSPRPVARGFSLVEVSVAMAVLSTSVLGVFHLYITSERLGILAREEALALSAAQAMINEIRSAPFSSSDPGVMSVTDYHHVTRNVNLIGIGAQEQRLGRAGAPVVSGSPDAIKVEAEMGVIVINQKQPKEDLYGDVDGDGDLDFPIDLDFNGSFTDKIVGGGNSIFPLPLGGDAGNDDETLSRALLQLVPVVVVVRWTSRAGMERRLQLMTLIADRAGGY